MFTLGTKGSRNSALWTIDSYLSEGVMWPRRRENDDDGYDGIILEVLQWFSPPCMYHLCIPGLVLLFSQPSAIHLPTGLPARNDTPYISPLLTHPTLSALNTLLLCQAFRWLEICILNVQPLHHILLSVCNLIFLSCPRSYLCLA